jgi:Tol biopolymer transport system component
MQIIKFTLCNKTRLMSLIYTAAIVLSSVNAYADYTIEQAVNTGTPVCSSYDDSSPFISADGLSLYFASNRPGGSGDFDLLVATRTPASETWSEPVNLGQSINSSSLEWHPSLTADGLELYFDSDRPGGQGSWDLWVSKRESIEDDWETPVNLGPQINTSLFEESSSISGDGLTLLWNSKRPGGFGDSDIWMTTRSSRDQPWGEPVNIGPAINTELLESNAIISTDGSAIFFTAWPWPDGYGDFDIWFARRAGDDWSEPVNIGPNINTAFSEYCPNISSDGKMLYFSDWPTQRPGGNGAEDIWQASIEPIVDFNGDENIDTNDLLILMDNWKTSESLCDIGPMPWGDGVVDFEDLKVFIEYWESENLPNEEQ